MAIIPDTRTRKWAARILDSGLTPLDKVRKLVALGYDEDTADRLVGQVSLGPTQMVYYEQLPGPDYSSEH